MNGADRWTVRYAAAHIATGLHLGLGRVHGNWEATHSSLTELGLHITATSRTPCNADGLAGAEAALVQCWRYFVCSAEQRRLLTFIICFHSHTLRALCNSRGTDEGTTHWIWAIFVDAVSAAHGR